MYCKKFFSLLTCREVHFTFHLSIHIRIDYLAVLNHCIDLFLFFLLEFSSSFHLIHSFYSISHVHIPLFSISDHHLLIPSIVSPCFPFSWLEHHPFQCYSLDSLVPLNLFFFFIFEVKSMLMSHWVTIQKSLKCCMLYYRLFCFVFLFFFLFSYSSMLKSCWVSYWLCIRTSLILSSLLQHDVGS